METRLFLWSRKVHLTRDPFLTFTTPYLTQDQMSEFEICEWRRCFLLSRSRQMFWVWSVACISHSDICRGLIEFNPNTCSSDQPTIDLVIQARRWRQHAKTTRCGISRRHGDSSPAYGWLCNLRTFLTNRRRDRRILMWWHSKNVLNRSTTCTPPQTLMLKC